MDTQGIVARWKNASGDVRATTSTGKDDTRISRFLVQPLIFSVVNHGDDTTISVIMEISVLNFVVIDKYKSL